MPIEEIKHTKDSDLFSMPVLFLIFNRPDTTKQVFERIKEIRPPHLYIAADGPRANKPGDKKKCEEARALVTDIEWDCKVKTLFRDDNLGCKKAVSNAIDWFFEHEEMGVILEDDCLPGKSFFPFCEEMLKRYRSDDRIMHINGNNYGAQYENFSKSDYSYHFGNMPQVWGWATWKSAWSNFRLEIDEFDYFIGFRYLDQIFENRVHKNKQIRRWENAFSNKVDVWGYQWQYAVMANHGLTVVPKQNLISNIGFGRAGTNTTNKNSEKANLKAGILNFPLEHPDFVAPDFKINQWYQKKMLGSGSPWQWFKNRIKILINYESAK